MRARPATVATVLLPGERSRVEAAGQGCFVARHAETLDDASLTARQGADALVLSVHRCHEADLPRVARFVREFPHVPAVALVSNPDARTVARVLRLGASGVQSVIDVSDPTGWQQLRDWLREPVSPVVARVLAALAADLDAAPADCRLFFELLIRRAPDLLTVGALARALRVVASSFVSRFVRARLPSPRTYLAHVRLLHAAWLFRSEGFSIADVAHRLNYSSPQSFGRHLRTLLGLTAGEFRRRLPFEATLARFRATFITPYRDRLLAFHPLGTMPGDRGRSAA